MKLIVTLVLSLTASGATARGPDIAAQIDAYLRAPRSANIYRALANLGDPTFGASEEPFAGWDQDAIFVGDRLGGACRTGYAHRVWNQRKAELGENHPYAQRWLATQRAVFASCAGWNDEERRPQPLPPPLSLADERIRRMQAADRAYQSSAKLFYDQPAAARIAFAALASEPGPHRDAAKLMVASIATGSRPGWNSVPNPKALPAAEALLSGAPTSSAKLDAQQLVGWLGATADTPATRAAQIRVTDVATPREILAAAPCALNPDTATGPCATA